MAEESESQKSISTSGPGFSPGCLWTVAVAGLVITVFSGVQTGVYRAGLEKARLERIRSDKNEAQENATRRAETKKALNEIQSMINGDLKKRWSQYDLCIKLGSAQVNSAMKTLIGPDHSDLIVPQVIPEWLGYCLTGKFTPRNSKAKGES
jgi:uncharacterized protein HemX